MPRKSISNASRAMIIGLTLDKSNSNRKIAKIVGVSEKCVRTTRKNFEMTGHTKELPRPGRIEKLTKRDKSSILKIVKKNPKLSFRDISREFNTKFKNHTVSVTTIRKFLKNINIGAFSEFRKPLLTVSNEDTTSTDFLSNENTTSTTTATTNGIFELNNERTFFGK
jgi:transposase